MRPPRIDTPDYPYHIFVRGNNKQALFRNDSDRETYLGMMQKSRRKFGFSLYSYALMDNHIHLMLQMCKGFLLASLMHWLQLGYARYFNERHRHVGHVFQARYHALLVDKDNYFLAVDRYIHLNPVRAGMVQRPEDFRWSSYRHRLGLAGIVDVDHEAVLAYFGTTQESQRKNYVAFTESTMQKPEEWDHDVLKKMSCLGSAEFLQQISSTLRR